MCCGAIFWGNVRRIVYGLSEKGLYEIIGDDSDEVFSYPSKDLLEKGKKSFEIIDDETNSVWGITGLCTKGELKGKELTPEPHSNHFAFAWLTFHPESEIYKE